MCQTKVTFASFQIHIKSLTSHLFFYLILFTINQKTPNKSEIVDTDISTNNIITEAAFSVLSDGYLLYRGIAEHDTQSLKIL